MRSIKFQIGRLLLLLTAIRVANGDVLLVMCLAHLSLVPLVVLLFILLAHHLMQMCVVNSGLPFLLRTLCVILKMN